MKYRVNLVFQTNLGEGQHSPENMHIVYSCVLHLLAGSHCPAGEISVTEFLPSFFLIVRQLFSCLNVRAEDSTSLVLFLVVTWQSFSKSSCSSVLLGSSVSCTGHIRARRGHGKK